MGRIRLTLDDLTSLEGFPAAAEVGQLRIDGGPTVTLAPLASLTAVERQLEVRNLTVRDLSPLGRVEQVGSLTIADNESLETLHGLEGLRVVNGDLTIEGNDQLRDLTALRDLACVTGTVTVGGFRLSATSIREFEAMLAANQAERPAGPCAKP